MAGSDLFPFTQPSSSGDEAPDPATLASFLERMPGNKPSLEVRKRAILVGDPAVRRSAPSQFPAPLPISGHQNSPFVVRLSLSFPFLSLPGPRAALQPVPPGLFGSCSISPPRPRPNPAAFRPLSSKGDELLSDLLEAPTFWLADFPQSATRQ